MDLTRTEIDRMLRRADEVRTKLRRATRELQRAGDDIMTKREAARTAASRDATSAANPPFDADRSR